MVGKDFGVGDLVWAKMKGYPYWPAKIENPPPNQKTVRKAQHYVFFFGSKNYAWLMDEFIVPHSDEMLKSGSKKKSSALVNAIDEIVALSQSQTSLTRSFTPVQEGSDDEDAPPSPKRLTLISEKKFTAGSEKKFIAGSGKKFTVDLGKKFTVGKKSIGGSERKSAKVHRKVLVSKKDKPVKIAKRASRKRPSADSDSSHTMSPFKSRRVEDDDDDDYSDLLANITPSSTYSRVAVIHPYDDDPPHPTAGILARPPYIERPPTPPLDIEKVTDTLRNKDVTPTFKKIGFLGLGMMGRGVVKNLLNSGHDVTIWNRSPDKCAPFVEAGACQGMTPSDVVARCDITFCCVSDPDATRSLVFGNCGVLRGLEGCTRETKGYVEMSSIDHETSIEIGEAIKEVGGRYLEAPISGSREFAEEGLLLILGAGDEELFNECQSCFDAVSKHSHFLRTELGSATKMNLIVSMFFGTSFAALGESMALLDRCKLSMANFLEILELGPLGCTLLVEKGRAMLQRNFCTNVALKHQQKDLNLALSLGNDCDQPLLITAAANETYKHAKLLRYSDHDVSAVVCGAKY